MISKQFNPAFCIPDKENNEKPCLNVLEVNLRNNQGFSPLFFSAYHPASTACERFMNTFFSDSQYEANNPASDSVGRRTVTGYTPRGCAPGEARSVRGSKKGSSGPRHGSSELRSNMRKGLRALLSSADRGRDPEVIADGKYCGPVFCPYNGRNR